MNLLKDVCIDTHFVHRGRFVRMAQVIATNPTCIGLGIEEDTAVVIRNGNEAEIIGSGAVIIIEGFHINVHKHHRLWQQKGYIYKELKSSFAVKRTIHI